MYVHIHTHTHARTHTHTTSTWEGRLRACIARRNLACSEKSSSAISTTGAGRALETPVTEADAVVGEEGEEGEEGEGGEGGERGEGEDDVFGTLRDVAGRWPGGTYGTYGTYAAPAAAAPASPRLSSGT